jgi:hypothetical protein
MAAIKPIDQAAAKWRNRSAVAGGDYQAGVQNPRAPWAASAAAADGNYRQGVTAAAAGGRYAAGVRRAGDTKWTTNSLAKGPSRFAEGVSLAVEDWQRGFQPYQAAISGLTLPARGPAGSPANLQRVTAVATALRQLKERSGGGAR